MPVESLTNLRKKGPLQVVNHYSLWAFCWNVLTYFSVTIKMSNVQVWDNVKLCILESRTIILLLTSFLLLLLIWVQQNNKQYPISNLAVVKLPPLNHYPPLNNAHTNLLIYYCEELKDTFLVWIFWHAIYTPPKKYSSTWDISCPKTYIKCNFMKWILASHDL